MFNKRLFLPVFLLPLLIGCSGEKDQKNGTEPEILQTGIRTYDYKTLSEKSSQGLKISNIDFDTLSLHKDTKGLLVSFSIEAHANAFDSIAALGYNSFFVDLTCRSDDGKVFSHRSELFKDSNKKKYLNTHKECFISQPTDRSLEISFPYRMMELSEGEHDLIIDIEAFPAKFEDDSSSLHMKMLNSISKKPQTSISMKVKVRTPQLYKASFTVHKFALNTKVVKPEKFDFAVGGSGYPDLFWEVYCGNDYMYYSPVVKNKIQYIKSYSSPSFYCTSEDIINFAVVDYDNGPFNTQDDVIEKWTGRIADLPAGRTDTLRFGNLEYLVLEAKVE